MSEDLVSIEQLLANGWSESEARIIQTMYSYMHWDATEEDIAEAVGRELGVDPVYALRLYMEDQKKLGFSEEKLRDPAMSWNRLNEEIRVEVLQDANVPQEFIDFTKRLDWWEIESKYPEIADSISDSSGLFFNDSKYEQLWSNPQREKDHMINITNTDNIYALTDLIGESKAREDSSRMVEPEIDYEEQDYEELTALLDQDPYSYLENRSEDMNIEDIADRLGNTGVSLSFPKDYNPWETPSNKDWEEILTSESLNGFDFEDVKDGDVMEETIGREARPTDVVECINCGSRDVQVVSSGWISIYECERCNYSFDSNGNDLSDSYGGTGTKDYKNFVLGEAFSREESMLKSEVDSPYEITNRNGELIAQFVLTKDEVQTLINKYQANYMNDHYGSGDAVVVTASDGQDVSRLFDNAVQEWETVSIENIDKQLDYLLGDDNE